jgi:hypothetical protein
MTRPWGRGEGPPRMYEIGSQQVFGSHFSAGGYVKARRAASILLAAGLLFSATGCTLFAVQGTLRHYEPSDGVGANIGDVKLRNVLGLSADGKDVAIVLTIVNEGDNGATVEFQFENGSGEKKTQFVYVRPHASKSVGNVDDSKLVLRGIDTTVGGLVPLYVQYGDVQGKQLLVPVLDGTLASYTDLLPSPEPTPSPTPTPSN